MSQLKNFNKEEEARMIVIEKSMIAWDMSTEEGTLRNIKTLTQRGCEEYLIKEVFRRKGLKWPEEKPKEKIVLMSKFSPVPYAEEIMELNKFLFDNYKRFWRYDNNEGIWKEDAEMFIKNMLRTRLMGEEQQKKNYVDEVVNYIKDVSWTEEDLTNPPENIVAFQNCLFNIDTEEIIDFSPTYFITQKIPVEIDSKFCDCPVIDAFFEDCVGKELKQSMYELTAYTLLRSYPYQKFFILYGKGQNGKSVYLNLLRKFLGFRNVSNETPQNLVQNRFARGNLWNKLANIGSDIPYISLDNTNTIKELTGEDATNCERKFKEAFPFKNYAKIIWSANELPQINDKTFAFYRRVYIFSFNNVVSKPDPFLLDRLSSKEQLSGLAMICVRLLKELRKRNYKFTWDPPVEDMEQMYEDLSNPLNRFIREKTDNKQDGKIAKWEFKEKFMAWLRANGFRIWGEREINSTMRERYTEGKIEVQVEVPQHVGYGNYSSSETKYHRCWEGLKWKKD